jgi:hypothetical protein
VSYAVGYGECAVCKQVKPGRVVPLPSNWPGGVVVKAGRPPVAHICFDCEAKQIQGLERLAALQRVYVHLDDDGWIAGHFERPGQPDEAITVRDARVDGGTYKRDVGWVRRDDSGDVERFPYAQIRAA